MKAMERGGRWEEGAGEGGSTRKGVGEVCGGGGSGGGGGGGERQTRCWQAQV